MSIILTLYIIFHCIIGMIFHAGISKEYENDMSGELDHLSPGFVNIMIVCVSICWPILLVYSVYLKFKGK